MEERTDVPDISRLIDALNAMRDSLVLSAQALRDLQYEINTEQLKQACKESEDLCAHLRNTAR